MKGKSLKALFESQKDELLEKLDGLSLPKDASKIQALIKDYFNNLVDSNGDFRQSLTQSEDYMLQAAMSLLNAQQDILKELSYSSCNVNEKSRPSPSVSTESNSLPTNKGLKKELFPHAIGATAVGGAVGGLVLGTWGAVFGSIAGTAIILYYASNQKSETSNKVNNIAKPIANLSNAKDSDIKINASAFVNIISNICDSLDSLIETFRSQINRVVNKYENQPKPTLESNFYAILEGIQSVVGYERTHDFTEEKYSSKLKQRVEDLAELLDNYSLSVVDYTPEKDSWFERTESHNVNEPKMSLPAIVKDNNVILKGRVFVKAN